VIEPPPVDPYAELKSRPFVQAWTVDDLMPALERRKPGQPGERPADLCRSDVQPLSSGQPQRRDHRAGPDRGYPPVRPAGSCSSRSSNRAKWCRINTAPSRSLTKDGDSVIGRIADLNDDFIQVLTDLINPAAFQRVPTAEIEDIVPSRLSMMPTGLLDHFTEAEIRDLDSAGR
jgi:hypothetical protein